MTNDLATIKEFDYSAIENADLAETTKYKYRRELQKYFNAGHNLADTKTLQEYAQGLTKSRKAFLKAAVRLYVKGLELDLKSEATPDNIKKTQAALLRLEAMQETIKVKQSNGTKPHTWLSQSEVKELINAIDNEQDDMTALRDWVVIALMVGAGLRRDELTKVKFSDIHIVPKNGNGGYRDVLHIEGKGAKGRDIPIKSILAERIEDWRQMINADPDDLIARSLGRKKELGKSISGVAVFHLVRKYGKAIGRPELAPHDLRRTYAQLGYDAGVPITQITKLLGHESVATTQRYLNLDLDLQTTVSDFIPLD